MQSLLEHSPQYLRHVWQMLMTTGLRKRELIALVFDDVDFERRTITVRATNAKNHQAREIPLSNEMLATITRLRDRPAARRRQATATPASPPRSGPPSPATTSSSPAQHPLAEQPLGPLL